MRPARRKDGVHGRRGDGQGRARQALQGRPLGRGGVDARTGPRCPGRERATGRARPRSSSGWRLPDRLGCRAPLQQHRPDDDITVAEKDGLNIRRIRRAADLSQEACAECAEIHRTSMSLYEWGMREPKLETLVKIAGALEV